MKFKKRMDMHMLPKEIEESLGSPARLIRSFFCDRLSKFRVGSNPIERSTKEKFYDIISMNA